ncbi:unnamed protein product, partial [Mesorhabditis spiculigera]
MAQESIRVICRMLAPDGSATPGIRVKNRQVETIEPAGTYTFDGPIGMRNTSQKEIYEMLARRVVDGVTIGYNGTVFAYGQTGSGKTHTMVGPSEIANLAEIAEEDCGIIPQAIKQLFSFVQLKTKELGSGAFNSLIEVQYLQLYQEVWYDLLNGNELVKPRGGVIAASRHTVICAADALKLLQNGWSSRQTAETAMNRTSSRSHCVFVLDLTTENLNDELVLRSSARLNLVDLAGSERVAHTGTQYGSEQFKEGVAINQSLSVLSNVIRQLSKGASFVNYRDSQLTLFLKDSLAGSARTAILVTARNEKDHIANTVSTLNFASCCRNIKSKLNANVKVTGESVLALNNKVNRLNQELINQRTTITNEMEQRYAQMSEDYRVLKESHGALERRLAATDEKCRLQQDKMAIFASPVRRQADTPQAKLRRRTMFAPADVVDRAQGNRLLSFDNDEYPEHMRYAENAARMEADNDKDDAEMLNNQLQQKLDELETELCQRSSTITELQQKCAAGEEQHRAELEALQKNMSRAAEEANEAKANADRLKTEWATYRLTAGRDLDHLRDQNKAAMQRIEEMEEEREELRVAKERLEASLHKANENAQKSLDEERKHHKMKLEELIKSHEAELKKERARLDKMEELHRKTIQGLELNLKRQIDEKDAAGKRQTIDFQNEANIFRDRVENLETQLTEVKKQLVDNKNAQSRAQDDLKAKLDEIAEERDQYEQQYREKEGEALAEKSRADELKALLDVSEHGHRAAVKECEEWRKKVVEQVGHSNPNQKISMMQKMNDELGVLKRKFAATTAALDRANKVLLDNALPIVRVPRSCNNKENVPPSLLRAPNLKMTDDDVWDDFRLDAADEPPTNAEVGYDGPTTDISAPGFEANPAGEDNRNEFLAADQTQLPMSVDLGEDFSMDQDDKASCDSDIAHLIELSQLRSRAESEERLVATPPAKSRSYPALPAEEPVVAFTADANEIVDLGYDPYADMDGSDEGYHIPIDGYGHNAIGGRDTEDGSSTPSLAGEKPLGDEEIFLPNTPRYDLLTPGHTSDSQSSIERDSIDPQAYYRGMAPVDGRPAETTTEAQWAGHIPTAQLVHLQQMAPQGYGNRCPSTDYKEEVNQQPCAGSKEISNPESTPTEPNPAPQFAAANTIVGNQDIFLNQQPDYDDDDNDGPPAQKPAVSGFASSFCRNLDLASTPSLQSTAQKPPSESGTASSAGIPVALRPLGAEDVQPRSAFISGFPADIPSPAPVIPSIVPVNMASPAKDAGTTFATKWLTQQQPASPAAAVFQNLQGNERPWQALNKQPAPQHAPLIKAPAQPVTPAASEQPQQSAPAPDALVFRNYLAGGAKPVSRPSALYEMMAGCGLPKEVPKWQQPEKKDTSPVFNKNLDLPELSDSEFEGQEDGDEPETDDEFTPFKNSKERTKNNLRVWFQKGPTMPSSAPVTADVSVGEPRLVDSSLHIYTSTDWKTGVWVKSVDKGGKQRELVIYQRNRPESVQLLTTEYGFFTKRKIYWRRTNDERIEMHVCPAPSPLNHSFQINPQRCFSIYVVGVFGMYDLEKWAIYLKDDGESPLRHEKFIIWTDEFGILRPTFESIRSFHNTMMASLCPLQLCSLQIRVDFRRNGADEVLVFSEPSIINFNAMSKRLTVHTSLPRDVQRHRNLRFDCLRFEPPASGAPNEPLYYFNSRASPDLEFVCVRNLASPDMDQLLLDGHPRFHGLFYPDGQAVQPGKRLRMRGLIVGAKDWIMKVSEGQLVEQYRLHEELVASRRIAFGDDADDARC